MLPSWHYSRSIPEAIKAAISFKQIKDALLIGILAMLLWDISFEKVYELKEWDMGDTALVSNNTATDGGRVLAAIYFSSLYGNISARNVEELKKITRYSLPFDQVDDHLEHLDQIKNLLVETSIEERFVAESAFYHKKMGRVWISGTKYTYVPGKPVVVKGWTKEYEFGIKRGLFYPTYAFEYAGGNRAQQQISAFLKAEEEK